MFNPLDPAASAPTNQTVPTGPSLSAPASGIDALTGSKPQPAAPKSPANGSFGMKLLSAIGGVLSGFGTTVQNANAAAIDPAAELKRQDALQQQKAKMAQETQVRQDRLAQENHLNEREDAEAHVRIAESNARLHASQTAAYTQGEDFIDKRIAQGQHDLQSMEGAEVPAEVLQHGVDEGQMTALLNQGKINGYEYTAIPSGAKVVGTNADGNPVRQMTYDIVKVPETWHPTDDQIARIKTVPGYEKFQKGTIMPGSQVLSALSQADTIKTTHDAMDKARTEADLGKFSEEQKAASAQFVKSGDWLRYLNAYSGDPVKAAQHILTDPAMAQKYSTSLYRDVMSQFATEKDLTGVSGYSTMLHQQQEDANNRIKAVNTGLGQTPGVGGAMTDEMKANIAALPKDKQTVVSKYDAPTQAALYSVAFGPGDTDFDRVFPNRVSAKSNQIDAAHALGVIKQLRPNWSQQQYKQTGKAYHEITFGRNGQDVETYNNLLDHMSNAQDVIESTFRHENPKFLNSAINLAETQGWGTQATQLQTSLEPVKTELESLMNNGHALHADQQKLYDAMINPASTPAQLETAFKTFGATGIIRLLGLNDQYKKIAGQNVPGLLRKEAVESAKHLALDDKTMGYIKSLNSGDTLFHNPNWTPGTPEEQVQTVDTQKQQQLAASESAHTLATQAFQSGKQPQGSVGIMQGSDNNWYYADAQRKLLSRVQ
jgi:hypothetical protein